MKFDIVTIFPRMIEAGLAEGVISRGIERALLDVRVHDLRDHTSDRHRSVDDVPYGGGPGMVVLSGEYSSGSSSSPRVRSSASALAGRRSRSLSSS